MTDKVAGPDGSALSEGLGHTVPRPRWWVSLHKARDGRVIEADVCGEPGDPETKVVGQHAEAHAYRIAAALEAYRGPDPVPCRAQHGYSCGQGGSRCASCVA